MRRLWLTTSAAVVLLGGCGVGAQDEPHAVELPRHALTSPGAGPAEQVGEVAQVLCLVRDDKLVQTVRRTLSYPTPQAQLDSLTAGPNEAERAAGLTTVLSGAALIARGMSGAGLTVEVPDTNEGNGRNDDILAYGQIVCTLTARPDVGEVVFTRDGQRLEVPRGDSTLTNAPLRSSDYAGLVLPG
ncbi:GerMN domain-containing protein [Actinoplanes sp. LDG1-06]|uniref:GerMN domain-containing protein n=1 Tax=Paractinoplanes ovalisporus TaxID=2810368 RepID=A0ABS2A466_9ACTN|nr:GerMN domain-containing protein [Actinoplanes ovalisporus]MBM2614619.1 GerMN domain-containing protein [Actinoplanes ovalisporus]